MTPMTQRKTGKGWLKEKEGTRRKTEELRRAENGLSAWAGKAS